MILYRGKKISPKGIKRILLGRFILWEKETAILKLSAPVIELVEESEEVQPSVPGGMTPAILGIAILGKTILGVTSVGPKLEAPVIRLSSGGERIAAPVIYLTDSAEVLKLSAPVIRLSAAEDGEVIGKLKLASPVIRLEEYADGEEPEVPETLKLEAPVITLEVIGNGGEEPEEPEEPVITKLEAPEIHLEVIDEGEEEPEEPVVLKLSAPVIELVEESEEEPEPEPETEQLEAPVIELYTEEEPEPEAPEAPVLTLLAEDYLYNEANGTYDVCFRIGKVEGAESYRYTYLSSDGSIAYQQSKAMSNDFEVINAYSILRLHECEEGTYSVYAEALANGVYSEKSNFITFEYSEEHEHRYSQSVTEPTCTEDGEIAYTCSCGDGYAETVPAKGHDYGEPYYSDEFSTGYGRKCSVCGELLNLENRKLSAPVIELYTETAEPGLAGDVNGDGKVTIEDYNLLRSYLSGSADESEIQIENADLNGDGKINIADASLIRQMCTLEAPVIELYTEEETAGGEEPVLTISGDVLSWTEVSGASGYMIVSSTQPNTSGSVITLNDGTQYYLIASTTETTVDLTERKADFAAGEYTLYVMAYKTDNSIVLSNGVTYFVE